MAGLKVYKPRLVPGKDIVPIDLNPNDMSSDKFDGLVSSMNNDGFLQNVVLAPIGVMPKEFIEMHDDKKYVTVAGEHRVRSAMVIDPDAEIPSVILEDKKDLDEIHALVVRMNLLKGKMNLQEVAQIYNEIKGKHGAIKTRKMMGVTSDAEFDRIIASVRKGLPNEEMKKAFDSATKDVETAEDLAAVVNMIYMKGAGDIKKYGFLSFVYQGQVHLMIQMNRRLRKVVDMLIDHCRAEKKDASQFIAVLLRSGWEQFDDDESEVEAQD